MAARKSLSWARGAKLGGSPEENKGLVRGATGGGGEGCRAAAAGAVPGPAREQSPKHTR